MHGLRTDVFGHLQRQSLAFFTRTRGGEVQSRLTNDIGGMQSVVTSTATSIASNVTTAVGTAVAMVALSWRLSLLSLLVHPAGRLDDPPGRPAAPRRSPRDASAGSPTCTRQVEESPLRQRHPLVKTLGAGRRRLSPVHRDLDATWSTSRSAPSSPAAGGWPR